MQKINTMKNLLTTIFFVVITWGLLLQTYPDKNTNWNYLFNSGFSIMFILGAVLNLWCSSKLKTTGNPKNVIYFLGLSLLFYGFGLNIWTYYTFAYSQEVPYPALPDAFFVFFYPLLFTASFFFLKLFSFLVSEKILRQMFLLLIILSIMILGVFIRPEISEGISFWANILNVYYPLMSAVILTLALTIIRVSGGESTRSALLLSLGLATHGISTFFFSMRTAAGTYWNGDYTDILLAFSAYLIAMAGLNIIASLTPEDTGGNN